MSAAAVAQAQELLNAAAAAAQRGTSPALVDIDTDDEPAPDADAAGASMASTLMPPTSAEGSPAPEGEVVNVDDADADAAPKDPKTEADEEEDELATPAPEDDDADTPAAPASPEDITKTKTLSPAPVAAELDGADVSMADRHTGDPEEKALEGAVPEADAHLEADDEFAVPAASPPAEVGKDAPAATATLETEVAAATLEETTDGPVTVLAEDNTDTDDIVVDDIADESNKGTAAPAANTEATPIASVVDDIPATNGSEALPAANGSEATPAKRKAETSLERLMVKYGRRDADGQISKELKALEAQFKADTKDLLDALERCKNETAVALRHKDDMNRINAALVDRVPALRKELDDTVLAMFDSVRDLSLAIQAHMDAQLAEHNAETAIKKTEMLFTRDKAILEERRFKAAYDLAGKDVECTLAEEE